MTYDEMEDYVNHLFFSMEEIAEEYIEDNLELDSNYYFNIAMVELLKEDYSSAEKNMRLAADYGGARAKSVVDQISPKRNIFFLKSKNKYDASTILKSFLSDTIQEAIDETFSPPSKESAKLIQQHKDQAMEYFRIGEYDKVRLEETFLSLQKAVGLNDCACFIILKQLKEAQSRKTAL